MGVSWRRTWCQCSQRLDLGSPVQPDQRVDQDASSYHGFRRSLYLLARITNKKTKYRIRPETNALPAHPAIVDLTVRLSKNAPWFFRLHQLLSFCWPRPLPLLPRLRHVDTFRDRIRADVRLRCSLRFRRCSDSIHPPSQARVSCSLYRANTGSMSSMICRTNFHSPSCGPVDFVLWHTATQPLLVPTERPGPRV